MPGLLASSNGARSRLAATIASAPPIEGPAPRPTIAELGPVGASVLPQRPASRISVESAPDGSGPMGRGGRIRPQLEMSWPAGDVEHTTIGGSGAPSGPHIAGGRNTQMRR